MVSWKQYVDNALLSNHAIKRAGIFGVVGSVKDYACVNFAPLIEEVNVLADAFADPRHVVANGLKMEGDTYVCLMTNSNTIRARLANKGLVAAKTHRCVVVVVYEDVAKYSNSVMTTVAKLANYLTAHDF